MAIRVNFCISSIGMAIAASFFSAIALTPAARSNDAANQKLGTVRTLPSLQTRAHPPLQPDTLHLGMLEPQFFKYAQDNNWAAIEPPPRQPAHLQRLAPQRRTVALQRRQGPPPNRPWRRETRRLPSGRCCRGSRNAASAPSGIFSPLVTSRTCSGSPARLGSGWTRRCGSGRGPSPPGWPS